MLVRVVVVGVAFSLLEVRVPLTTICSVAGVPWRDRRVGVCGGLSLNSAEMRTRGQKGWSRKTGAAAETGLFQGILVAVLVHKPSGEAFHCASLSVK